MIQRVIGFWCCRGSSSSSSKGLSSSLFLSSSSLRLFLLLSLLVLFGNNDRHQGIRLVGVSASSTASSGANANHQDVPTNNRNNKKILSAAADEQDDPLPTIVTDLIQWFRSKGGYMNDKLEIRRRNPADPTSPAGVFATANLEADEILWTIPPQAQLAVLDDISEEHVLEHYHEALCRLAQRLLEEIRLYQTSPTASDYGPYIRYLQETQARGQLPATYSRNAKALLRKIQGIPNYYNSESLHPINDEKDKIISDNYGNAPLPPMGLVDWIDENFSTCFSPSSSSAAAATSDKGLDEEAYHAAAMIVQRGYDLELIPIWDMVNHDIPERINVETSSLRHATSTQPFQIWTTQPIQAGQEILYTYNYCADCHEIGSSWGAPGIFRDFGFLEENFPQEWPFLDQEVYSQILLLPGEKEEDEDDDDDEEESDNAFLYKGQKYKAFFFSEKNGNVEYVYAPKKEDLAFFRKHQARLQAMDLVTELQAVTSSYERFWIEKYFDSMLIAISTIVDAGVDYHKSRANPKLPQDADDDDDDDDDNGAKEL